MAQVTETVARGILAGHGYTDNEVRQLAHHWLASHGQAPADAKALAEADRRAGEAERILATCKENVMRFEQVRSRMKYQWGADQRVSFDEVWDEALALKKAARADSAQEDALRERDEADDFIDTLLDEVLGADRAEWSSAYGRADALEEVRERITALHKPTVDRAWKQFEAAIKQGATK